MVKGEEVGVRDPRAPFQPLRQPISTSQLDEGAVRRVRPALRHNLRTGNLQDLSPASRALRVWPGVAVEEVPIQDLHVLHRVVRWFWNGSEVEIHG